MEQRWKWEASFICGEKASFVQYLLDNYTERDLVDMVTDIEDTKKAIDCQEKEMETGILYLCIYAGTDKRTYNSICIFLL